MQRLARFSYLLHSRPTPFLGAPLYGGRRHLVVGNTKNGVQPTVDVNWIDIVGNDTALPTRLAAGELLAMMDLCAKRVADVFLSPTRQNISTSTVGVTQTIFSSPVLHGDAIRMNGKLVYCGSSSLGIYIRFYRRSLSTLMEAPVGESFFTMVAIDSKLKAMKVVPAVELTSEEDIDHYNRYVFFRKAHKDEEDRKNDPVRDATLTPENVECDINRAKASHVSISSTRTQANRIFLLYHMNNNRTIFGGELMRWMERHAVHCASMFTGNRHVYTVGMHSVAFHQPVFGTDWVRLDADVVYVHNTTMQIDVKLAVEREGRVVITNRASFVVFNSNEIGQKINVPKGLLLKDATQDELERFEEAKKRCQRRRKSG